MLSTIKEKPLNTKAKWVERITKKSQQMERARNTSKIDRKLTLTDKVQGSKSLQLKQCPTKVLSHQLLNM